MPEESCIRESWAHQKQPRWSGLILHVHLHGVWKVLDPLNVLTKEYGNKYSHLRPPGTTRAGTQSSSAFWCKISLYRAHHRRSMMQHLAVARSPQTLDDATSHRSEITTDACWRNRDHHSHPSPWPDEPSSPQSINSACRWSALCTYQ